MLRALLPSPPLLVFKMYYFWLRLFSLSLRFSANGISYYRHMALEVYFWFAQANTTPKKTKLKEIFGSVFERQQIYQRWHCGSWLVILFLPNKERHREFSFFVLRANEWNSGSGLFMIRLDNGAKFKLLVHRSYLYTPTAQVIVPTPR